MGGKCSECKSYNTTRIGDDLIDEKDKVVNADSPAEVGTDDHGDDEWQDVQDEEEEEEERKEWI